MNASLWAIVVVFVTLGLSLLFVLINVLVAERTSRSSWGVVGVGLFGVLLGWAAFYGGVAVSGQKID